MQNKDEAHIVLLPTMTREALKQLILLEVLDNDNKLITPQMVRTVFNALVDSVINWQDDTVDLRGYHTEVLTAIDNQTEFTLQFIPINPNKDMHLTVDGIDQQYGIDFTVVDNILTFIPATDWTIKATMRVAVKYRYFTVTSSGGGSGGGGVTPSFNYIEVAIANQTNVTITHNLGRLPIGIMVYDNLGNVVICSEQATNSTLTLEFSQSFTGTVLFI
jgi:hypothetical protein